MAGHQGQGPVSIGSGAIHGDSILVGINGRTESEQQRGFPALPSSCESLPNLSPLGCLCLGKKKGEGLI